MIRRTYGKITLPATGCMFGADDTTRGFTGPLGIETQLGRTMRIRNRHAGWNAFGSGVATIAATAAQDAAAGAIPMLSIGGQGWPTGPAGGLSQIATGLLNHAIQALLTSIEAVTAGWILRPMMEMNGSHNAAYYGNPELYKAAYQQIAVIAREVAPNCVLVFCPQQKSSSGVDPAAWQAYEPVDYDWGGVDLYRTTLDTALPFIHHYHQAAKPTVICESGFEQGQIVNTGSAKFDKDGTKTGHSLILDTLNQAKAHPNLIAYLVWNNIGPAGNDYIDTSPQSLEQYRQFANDPYFA